MFRYGCVIPNNKIGLMSRSCQSVRPPLFLPMGQLDLLRTLTGVKYPLLRACSSSAALTAAGLHTHVRTRRTSSDPAYLHTYIYLYMKREEEECCYFRNPGPKKDFRVTASLKPRPRNPGLKGLSGNGFTRTVTPHLRSIVPNVQRHMAYFAPFCLGLD